MSDRPELEPAGLVLWTECQTCQGIGDIVDDWTNPDDPHLLICRACGGKGFVPYATIPADPR